MKKTGIELIGQERKEQIEKHGYTTDIDKDVNKYCELLGAAEYIINKDRNKFPLRWHLSLMEKFDKKSRIEQLTVAGALIAAEIDRLNEL